MKAKYCDIGEHEVPTLFHARKPNRPSCCKNCYRPNQSATQGKKVAPIASNDVRKPISKVSTKQAKINQAYTVLNKQFLKDNPICDVCGGLANQVHHKVGRIAHRTLDTTEWLPVCNFCHHEIEMNPLWAKSMGYSKDRL